MLWISFCASQSACKSVIGVELVMGLSLHASNVCPDSSLMVVLPDGQPHSRACMTSQDTMSSATYGQATSTCEDPLKLNLARDTGRQSTLPAHVTPRIAAACLLEKKVTSCSRKRGLYHSQSMVVVLQIVQSQGPLWNMYIVIKLQPPQISPEVLNPLLHIK